MNTSCQVTLGVPVYQGASFLRETLESIQIQTYPHFQVIISLDGTDPESELVCQPFLRDSRFRLVTQPNRLGWAGNINWLMDQVDTPFWCYYQQDDLTDPRYLEVLLDAAWKAPEAAVVYCDMVAFGKFSANFTQPSVTGHASSRLLTLLYAHYPAVAFRGLTRVEALRESGGILTNEMENFSCDTTWMAGVALWGELHRVPVYLYRKRYHEENTHTKWAAWPQERRTQAWLVHCADMLQQAMRVKSIPQERRLLWLAAVNRLVSRNASGFINVKELTDNQRMVILENFLHYLQNVRKSKVHRWMESSWEDLSQWTRGFFRRLP